jgi:competence protein ComEC
VRAQASERLRRLLPPDVSPVARALLLAERDDLPGAVRTRFAEAGLAHLLAISGLHVGMIGGAVVLLLGTFMGPARASVWSAAIVAVYVAAIGAPPSAVRASLLLAGWATARARGLPARPWDLLGGAALIALVADPLVLVEPGFQLSFAGFAGLGAGVSVWRSLRFRPVGRIAATVGRFRPLPRRVRRRLRLLGLAMAGGTGAFLATAPIAAVHFQHVAPAALVSHLAGAPLAGAAIGALAMALFLPPPLDALSADGAATVLRLMMALAGWISELPGAHFAARVPGRLTWMAILLSLAGLWRFLRWGRARSAVAVLRTARGRWILFDAGPRFGSRDAGRDVVLPLLRRYGARRVDLFVLSHPDLDHVGGFDSVHEAVPVFRILDSGHPIPKPSYARFLARTEEDRIRWLPAGQGDVVYLDNVTIRVLGPPAASAEASGAARANETSLLLRVSIGRALVYLNTGDATMEDESALLAAWGPDSARADLLKVGHHGSRTATASDFVSAVSPAIAVISAGRGNAHGHPHEAVLGRLSGAAVPRVWRTDQEGTLCIEIDEEKGWRVQGETDWHSSRRVARVLTSQRSDE